MIATLKTILPFLAVFSLFSCSSNIKLDNPRPQEVQFVLDGQEITVPPKSFMETNLDPGRHSVKITVAGGEVIADTTIEVKEAGLLHSGKEKYVVWRQLYGLQDNRKDLLNEEWVSLDSIKVHGDLRFYQPNVVYIEKTWDKDIDETLPKESTLYVTSDFVIKSKIFTVPDFIATYRTMAASAE